MPVPDTPSAAPAPGLGCIAGGALFVCASVVLWVAALLLYGVVVEQWGLVTVRREFGYEWGLLWAPLLAFGGAAGLTLALMRSRHARRPAVIVLALIVAALGFIAVTGLGLFF